MNKLNTRISWIDNVKAFAIIAVIWMHVGTIVPSELDIMPKDFIVSFNIQLFVFISGFCAYKSLNSISSLNSLLNYIEKITLRIGIPNFSFWLISYCSRSLYKQGESVIMFDDFKFFSAVIAIALFFTIVILSTRKNTKCVNKHVLAAAIFIISFSNKFTTHWFLPFIMQTSLLASISLFLTKKFNKLQILLFPCVFFILMFVYPSTFHSTMEMCTFYYLGYIASKTNILDKCKKSILILVAFLSSLFYIILFRQTICDLNWYYSPVYTLSPSELYIYIIRQLMAMLAIISITSSFRVISKRYTVFSSLGKKTLVLYPIHGIIIYVLSLTNIFYHLPKSYVVKPATVSFILLISFIFTLIIDKAQYLRKLLYGEV